MKPASLLPLAFLIALSTTSAAPANEALTDRIAASGGDILVHPVRHASVVVSWKATTLYVDPVGDVAWYSNFPGPDIILLTDIHEDHLDLHAVRAFARRETRIVAPPAVASLLPIELSRQVVIMGNGETRRVSGVALSAIPMYNLRPDRLKLHPRGRGNGYVATLGARRLYFSGDTEDIPEMRALVNVDAAFLAMVAPYTLSIEQASDAVREFRPKIVYPYHYQDSDTLKFKAMVKEHSPSIDVRLLNWYAP